MSTIYITSGALQALVTLKRDKIPLTGLAVDPHPGMTRLDYSHDAFNALLALGQATDNVRFTVYVPSIDENTLAVMEAADWKYREIDDLWHNPKWAKNDTYPVYQVQFKQKSETPVINMEDGSQVSSEIVEKILYVDVTDTQIENILLEGRCHLMRIFCPTEQQITKYQLTATKLPGVYNF